VGTRHSEYSRADGDFYIEPGWAVRALLHHLRLQSGIHDPCCGVGTIVDTALQHGLHATGADIVDRSRGRFPVRDFLTDTSIHANVVTNPPYRNTTEIIDHAFDHVVDHGRVAALVPISFLASQRRYPLFYRPECELVLVLSRRPSLPPGELLQKYGECIRGSGSTDFVWTVWQRGKTERATRIYWAVP
jgi:hypothetical protein